MGTRSRIFVLKISNDPIIQNACRSIYAESRDIQEFFVINRLSWEILQKVEACILNRCSELGDVSEKLRDIEERKRISPTIREAKKDFVLEDCLIKCESPLDLYKSWVVNTSNMY